MEFNYKDDRVTIFIDLTTGQIIYKNILKLAISKCLDLTYLQDFKSRFESYVGAHLNVINQDEVNEIRKALNNRISFIENLQTISRKDNQNMLDNKLLKSIETFKNICEGKEVTENDNHLLERHINELMGKMRNQTITAEEQLLLDEYISYKQNNELQEAYSNNIESLNKTQEHQKENKNERVLRLEPVKNNQTGFVSIIAIFESVILLGILLGAVIITLAFK